MDQKDNGFFLYATAMYATALQHLAKVRQAEPPQPYVPPPQNIAFNWDLDTRDNVWFKKNVRFTKEEVRRLEPLLDLRSIVYRHRMECPPENALCIHPQSGLISKGS